MDFFLFGEALNHVVEVVTHQTLVDLVEGVYLVLDVGFVLNIDQLTSVTQALAWYVVTAFSNTAHHRREETLMRVIGYFEKVLLLKKLLILLDFGILHLNLLLQRSYLVLKILVFLVRFL